MRRHCNLVRTRPFVSPAVLLHTWRSSICYLRQLGLLTFRPQLHQPRENDGVAVNNMKGTKQKTARNLPVRRCAVNNIIMPAYSFTKYGVAATPPPPPGDFFLFLIPLNLIY